MKAYLLVCNSRNPSWELTTEHIKVIHEFLLAIPGTLDSWDKIPDHGYRGIKVDMDPLETMWVFEGIAEIVSNNEVRRFIDLNRELENWLFGTALNKVPDEVYNHLLTREFTRR